MGVMLIGIAGGTGSGKTTLTEHLKQHFGDDITVSVRTSPSRSAARQTMTIPTPSTRRCSSSTCAR